MRYATIHIVEDDIDITESNDLQTFKIEDFCFVNDKFIGTTVSKKITVTLLNDGQYDLENKEISVETGLKVDGTIEYVPMGNYIIEKPDTEETTTTTEFTGYDYMIKFNDTYEDRISYPTTAGLLLQDVCDQAGVECGSTDFVNSDYVILGNPFTNSETRKTVVSNIAQLAGGFAHIGRDNKLYIKTLAITSSYDELLDGNNYFDFSKNNKFGEINAVTLSVSWTEGEDTTEKDDEAISSEGLKELRIEDNYFLTDEEEREKAIVELWSSLKGLEYMPFETETYYGYPYLDIGDKLCIKDNQDVEYLTYVFNHTFEYNGGYSGTLKTEALTEVQTAYKDTNTTQMKIFNAERKIDKINGIIEDVVEEQTETSEKLTQHQQDIDSIKDSVSDVEKDLNENYSTTTEMNSAIEQKADSITSSVSKTIENIQVGGTNLITNSAPYSLDDYSLTSSTQIELTLQDEETAPFAKCLRIRTLAQLTTQQGIFKMVDALEEGKEYCFSLWLKATANTSGVLVGYGKGGQTTLDVTTEWQKYTYKFTATAPTSAQHGFTIYIPSGTILGRQIFVHSIKLEEGNQITSWSPAPDDNATKTEMNAKFELETENINLELSKKVGNDEVIASINMSTETEEDGSTMKLKADKISLEGTVTANSNFKIDEDGNMECKSAKCEDIEITSGSINMILDDTTADVQSFTLYDNVNNIYLNFTGHGFQINGYYDGVWTRGIVDMGVATNNGHGYLNCTGQVTCSVLACEDGTLELSGTTPYIDFHYNYSGADYTARIIELSSGVLTVYNSITSASDERLKNNIEDIDSKYMELFDKLEVKTYNFNNSDVLDCGFIAQDVLKLEEDLEIEESVLVRNTGEEHEVDGKTQIDYYSLNYNNLTAMCVKKIQELQEKDKQKDELIQSLITRIENLEKEK